MNNGIRVVNGGMQPQKEEPSYEESVRFQAKLIGLWEQQQSVLGYTKATIALNISVKGAQTLTSKAFGL